MTLIVGILCSDGAVLGSDAAATFGSLGLNTILQPTQKISVISDCVAVGVSGSVGLSQRITRVAESAWGDGSSLGTMNPVDVGVLLRTQIWNTVLSGEIQAATASQNLFGRDVAQSSATALSLIALPLNRKMALIQFDQSGAPEVVTPSLPFVAVGSGQLIADPFLAFLRRIFWADRQPTVAEGIFATLWTLQHAIQTNPGGVGGPPQIFVMKNEDCRVRELTENELREQAESVSAAEGHLRQYRGILDGTASASAPPPPEPPVSSA